MEKDARRGGFGMTGAVDNDYDDAKRDPQERLRDTEASYNRQIGKGDVALDLVTGQPVFVADVAAESVADHLEAEDFDLIAYKFHPYLPIQAEDAVFECVFIPTNGQDLIHRSKSAKTYDFPNGRLARIAVEEVTDGLRPQEESAARVLSRVIDYTDVDNRDTVMSVLRKAFFRELLEEAAARSEVSINE